MSNSGFIKIRNDIVSGWRWWDDHNTTRLYIYCVASAVWEDRQWREHDLKRGQLVTSIRALSNGTGLSEQQVKTALKHLILTGELTSKTYSNYRIITVKNYDCDDEANKVTNKQLTSKQQATNRQVTGNQQATNNILRNKEEKNIRREEGGARARANSTPAPDDVLFLGDYGNVRISSAELERFEQEYPTMASRTIQRLSQYMAETGKEYRDHYAVLCRWAKEDTERDRKKAEQESERRTYDIAEFDDMDFDFEKAMESLKHD